jgi:hypothetical protein
MTPFGRMVLGAGAGLVAEKHIKARSDFGIVP